MTIEINYNRGLELLHEVSRDRKDFIYKRHAGLLNSCTYIHNGEPDCIIGHALVSVGVPIEKLEEVNTCRIGATTPTDDKGIMPIPEFLGIKMTRAALDLFTAVQAYQDQGNPWGNSIEMAVGQFQVKE